MKLTDTNRSIDLIVPIAHIYQIQLHSLFLLHLNIPAFCRPGDYGEVDAPDTIPNSVVKRFSADGTLS